MVQYIATFQITMPETASQASGLMFYEVSNRGGNAIPTAAASVYPHSGYVAVVTQDTQGGRAQKKSWPPPAGSPRCPTRIFATS